MLSISLLTNVLDGKTVSDLIVKRLLVDRPNGYLNDSDGVLDQ